MFVVWTVEDEAALGGRWKEVKRDSDSVMALLMLEKRCLELVTGMVLLFCCQLMPLPSKTSRCSTSLSSRSH